MTTQFFERQETQKTYTRWLVWAFIAAILAVILVINLVVLVGLGGNPIRVLNEAPEFVFWTTLVVLVVITRLPKCARVVRPWPARWVACQ
jgi:hypothetical protein